MLMCPYYKLLQLLTLQTLPDEIFTDRSLKDVAWPVEKVQNKLLMKKQTALLLMHTILGT